MADMDKVGGVPTIMKELLNKGLLHGDALTVTGKSIEENLYTFNDRPDNQVIHPISSQKLINTVAQGGNYGPPGCPDSCGNS